MAKRTSLVFEDENLLRGVREQAIMAKIPMNQYIQDLIREDLRKKVGCKLIKIYDDGSREESELWSRYDAANAIKDCVNQMKNPAFTLDGQTAVTKRLADWEMWEHDELIASSNRR